MSDMDSARRAEPGDEAIDEVLDEGGYEGVERGYEGVERSDDVLGGVGVAPASRSERHRPRRGGFFRRHKALLALLILLGLVAGGVAGVGLYLNKQLSGIGRFSSTVPEAARPAPVPVEGNEEPGLTFLLAGADNGYDGSGIAETLRSGRWQPGVHRSDTMMVMHISGDRKRIYVVSIPRDTYVPVEGHGEDKINAAFSYGGPSLMQQTVEQFTGIRMDHVAVIDWNGFKDLSTALGGVTVYIPADVYDPMHRYQWTKGEHTLMGDEALEYVRTRYGLAGGDFDRIQRQQNFLREMLRKLVSKGTLTNPVTLNDSVGAITRNLVVDDALSNQAIGQLALSLKDIRTDDVTFLTIPITSFGTTAAGASVLNADKPVTTALFQALAAEKMPQFLLNNPGIGQLKAPSEVR